MVIYKTTNIINDKWYIGKDSKNNKGYFGSGIAIKKAIEKYGKENFKKEILEYCKDKNHLSEREKYWIESSNAKNDPKSYNMAEGGQGGNLTEFRKSSNKGKTYEEILGEDKANKLKEKRREAIKGEKNPMYGKKLSEEHIEKMRSANKNRVYHFDESARHNMSIAQKGKKASDETKSKMSKSRRGKTKKGISIIQIDENGLMINEFKSISECASFFNLSYSTTCRIISGENKNHTINLKINNGS